MPILSLVLHQSNNSSTPKWHLFYTKGKLNLHQRNILKQIVAIIIVKSSSPLHLLSRPWVYHNLLDNLVGRLLGKWSLFSYYRYCGFQKWDLTGRLALWAQILLVRVERFCVGRCARTNAKAIQVSNYLIFRTHVFWRFPLAPFLFISPLSQLRMVSYLCIASVVIIIIVVVNMSFTWPLFQYYVYSY